MDERSRFRANTRGRAGNGHANAIPTPSAARRKLKLPSSRRWLAGLIILLVIAVAGLAYGYVHTRNQLEDASKQTQASGGTETEQIINQVSKSVQLPNGEVPTIATVDNAAKLKDQVFFKDAQNGDKVLYYAKSGQAVLYRPSTNKVILFAYVNLPQSSPNGQ